MKKITRYLLPLLLVVGVIFGGTLGCTWEESVTSSSGTEDSMSASEDVKAADEIPAQEISSLEELNNTKIFAKHSLEHIFYGEINRKGRAVGYHSEIWPDTPGQVVEGTRSVPDQQGVYTGKVTVNGVEKAGNGGYSTFFPQDMTAQQVVDAIGEAYGTRQWDTGNTYLGESKEGLIVQMYLNDNDLIISAFPIQ